MSLYTPVILIFRQLFGPGGLIESGPMGGVTVGDVDGANVGDPVVGDLVVGLCEGAPVVGDLVVGDCDGAVDGPGQPESKGFALAFWVEAAFTATNNSPTFPHSD